MAALTPQAGPMCLWFLCCFVVLACYDEVLEIVVQMEPYKESDLVVCMCDSLEVWQTCMYL